VVSHVYLQDINMMKNEEMKCKFKMSHLEEIICLKLVVRMVIMDMRRLAQRRGSPIGVWGSNLRVFNKQTQSRKMFHLVVVKIIII